MSRFRDLWVSGKFAIDRKNKDVVDVQAEKEAAHMLRELIPDESQKLFTDLKNRRGQETGRWLKSLAPEAPKASQEWMQAQANAQDSFEEARVFIDAIFQEFAGLTFKFNENAVGTDLFVSCEKPQLVETRDDDVWYHPVTKSYQGRLTTRFWCLYVRGNDQKIGVYVFPAELTIGFKSGHYSDEEVPPFVVAEHGSISGKRNWTIQGEEAPLSVIPPLAKEMFGDLVRVASGKMSESELFASHSQAPKLGENVAVGYEPNQVTPKAAAPSAPSPAANISVEGLSVHDACDLVDKVIDLELQRLYQEATKQAPGTPMADKARRQISAVQTFRMRIIDAFENFTKESLAVVQEPSVPAGKS